MCPSNLCIYPSIHFLHLQSGRRGLLEPTFACILRVFSFSFISVLCWCSYPSVGEVCETLLHQDGLQHVRVLHSQYGLPELIHATNTLNACHKMSCHKIGGKGGLGWVDSPPYVPVFLSTLVVSQVINLVQKNNWSMNCITTPFCIYSTCFTDDHFRTLE